MKIFRINFDCKDCGFGMNTSFRDDTPNLFGIFTEHYKEFGHARYDLNIEEIDALTPRDMIETIRERFGPKNN